MKRTLLLAVIMIFYSNIVPAHSAIYNLSSDMTLMGKDTVEVLVSEARTWDDSFEPIKDDNSSWSTQSGFRFENSYRPRFGRTSAHWSGFGIHYSGMVQGLHRLQLPAEYADLKQTIQSIGVTINIADIALPITKHLGLFSGIGLEFNNFRFSKDVGLKQEGGNTVIDYQFIEQGIRLSKSKLNTGYINIPLMLEYQFGPGNDFFINGGLIGGFRIAGKTKIQSSDPRMRGTFKQWSNVSLRNFHFGYSVGLGYDKYSFFATYYPQSIFRNNIGPDIQQINIGILIVR